MHRSGIRSKFQGETDKSADMKFFFFQFEHLYCTCYILNCRTALFLIHFPYLHDLPGSSLSFVVWSNLDRSRQVELVYQFWG